MNFWQKHKKKIIIAIIVVVVSVILYFSIKAINKAKARRLAAERKAKAEADRKDPSKTTFVNEDGQVVSKESDLTKQQANEEIRKDAYYQKAYQSVEINNKAKVINDSWGWLINDYTGIQNSLMNLDRYTLLALQDLLANEYEIPSIHMYFKDMGMPDSLYDYNVNLMVQARNRYTKNLNLTIS